VTNFSIKMYESKIGQWKPIYISARLKVIYITYKNSENTTHLQQKEKLNQLRMFRKINYDCSVDPIRYMNKLCGRTGGTVGVTALRIKWPMCFQRLPYVQRAFKIMVCIEKVAHGFHLSHHICLIGEAESYQLHRPSHRKPLGTTSICEHS